MEQIGQGLPPYELLLGMTPRHTPGTLAPELEVKMETIARELAADPRIPEPEDQTSAAAARPQAAPTDDDRQQRRQEVVNPKCGRCSVDPPLTARQRARPQAGTSVGRPVYSGEAEQEQGGWMGGSAAGRCPRPVHPLTSPAREGGQQLPRSLFQLQRAQTNAVSKQTPPYIHFCKTISLHQVPIRAAVTQNGVHRRRFNGIHV